MTANLEVMEENKISVMGGLLLGFLNDGIGDVAEMQRRSGKSRQIIEHHLARLETLGFISRKQPNWRVTITLTKAGKEAVAGMTASAS